MANQPAPGSNVLTFIVVTLVVLGTLGFMFLLFGDLFLWALALFAVIGGIGCLHYFVWGRAMTEAAQQEKSELPATSTDPE